MRTRMQTILDSQGELSLIECIKIAIAHTHQRRILNGCWVRKGRKDVLTLMVFQLHG